MIARRHQLRRGVLLVAVGLAAASRGQTNLPTAASPGLDASTYQRLVDENLDLRRDQTRLTREANDLRRRNASLVLQVQELERKQAALTAALADYRSPEELKAELDRVRKERDTLSRDVERIRTEARTAAGGMAAPVPAAGSDLYRKLERENTELRGQLAAAQASVQSDSQARLAGSRRETQRAAQVEELNRELSAQRRELAQAAAHEKLLRTALVKVARKVHAYETTLRENEARRLALAAATNVVVGATARTSAPALLEAARKYVAAGRYRDAERLYLSGLQREPTNAPLHYSLGVLYDDYLQKPREAAIHYRRYLALNPTAPDAAIVRAWLLELDVESR
jgi:tetratricopeptide (TPR) repeat protein